MSSTKVLAHRLIGACARLHRIRISHNYYWSIWHRDTMLKMKTAKAWILGEKRFRKPLLSCSEHKTFFLMVSIIRGMNPDEILPQLHPLSSGATSMFDGKMLKAFWMKIEQKRQKRARGRYEGGGPYTNLCTCRFWEEILIVWQCFCNVLLSKRFSHVSIANRREAAVGRRRVQFGEVFSLHFIG